MPDALADDSAADLPQTGDQLADLQGVTPVRDLDDLEIDVWDDDVEVDEFIEDVRRARRANVA